MSIEKTPKEKLQSMLDNSTPRPARVPYGRWSSLVVQTNHIKKEAEARAAAESRKRWEKK